MNQMYISHYTKYNIILIEEAVSVKKKKKKERKKERGKLTLDQVL